MTKGALVGRGRTADVFEWDQGQILKLYHDWFPQRLIEQDIHISEAVCRAGLPVPRMDGTAMVDGRKGIVFERIEGQTLTRQMLSRPWQLKHYARLMAELHAEIHRFGAAELPSLRDTLRWRIEHSSSLDDRLKAAAFKALDRLPDGTAVCHGDFHPDNILVTSEKAYVIDWMTAAQGHPLADVARTSLILSLDNSPPDEKLTLIIRTFKGHLNRLYLRSYFGSMPGSTADLAPWALPVAAVRLDESSGREREQVLRLLERLTEKTA